jgi:hypothetical protein
MKKANEMLNRGLQREYKDQPIRKGKQSEQHKVINTSKNIYKPCFNMPAKDTSASDSGNQKVSSKAKPVTKRSTSAAKKAPVRSSSKVNLKRPDSKS